MWNSSIGHGCTSRNERRRLAEGTLCSPYPPLDSSLKGAAGDWLSWTPAFKGLGSCRLFRTAYHLVF